jgi:hypothetical protein
MNKDQLHALLYEALETEKGGVLVYETALTCAINEDLADEWAKYLDQTRNHVAILVDVMSKLGMNPDQETPGRTVVRYAGQSFVMTMAIALQTGLPEAAEMVAAECVVQAETKDHMNWELIGKAARALGGEEGAPLKNAYDQIEDQEDEHLYHTKGWARELWIESLGMPAVLPPPEEVKEVETAIGAAKAEASREMMLRPRTSTR